MTGPEVDVAIAEVEAIAAEIANAAFRAAVERQIGRAEIEGAMYEATGHVRWAPADPEMIADSATIGRWQQEEDS